MKGAARADPIACHSMNRRGVRFDARAPTGVRRSPAPNSSVMIEWLRQEPLGGAATNLDRPRPFALWRDRGVGAALASRLLRPFEGTHDTGTRSDENSRSAGRGRPASPDLAKSSEAG